MAGKVFESRFFWFTIFRDTQRYIQSCDNCQCSSIISHRFERPQDPIINCEVFDIWGIDFMGPLPSSYGHRYILVAVDYVSRWIEAQGFPTNDAWWLSRFWKKLCSCFRTPKVIISDRGTQFCNTQLDKVLKKYGVTYRISNPYHQQTSGQVELANRELKWILEKWLLSGEKIGQRN